MSFIQRSFVVGPGDLAPSTPVVVTLGLDPSTVGAEGSRLIVGNVMYFCPTDFLIVLNGDGSVEFTWNGGEDLPDGEHTLLVASAELSAQSKAASGSGSGGDANATNQTIGNNRLTEIKNAIAPVPSAAVTGTLAASGPGSVFIPAALRPFNLVLSGTWVGTVTVERQFGGAGDWFPCTFLGEAVEFTTNSSEVLDESEANVSYRVNFVRTSGTLGYRISQ